MKLLLFNLFGISPYTRTRVGPFTRVVAGRRVAEGLRKKRLDATPRRDEGAVPLLPQQQTAPRLDSDERCCDEPGDS